MKTVAVLDDDQSLVELYQTFLGEEGHEVRAVVFSPEVPTILENIRATDPAMLILDVHLPGLGSFEIMQGMLEDPKLASVRVLLCSASRPSLKALTQTMEKAKLKMPTVLEKPFDLDNLANIVNRLVNEAT